MKRHVIFLSGVCPLPSIPSCRWLLSERVRNELWQAVELALLGGSSVHPGKAALRRE